MKRVEDNTLSLGQRKGKPSVPVNRPQRDDASGVTGRVPKNQRIDDAITVKT